MSEKRGEWLPNIRGDYCAVCSECGFGVPITYAWMDCNRASDERETTVSFPGHASYCPGCGAKMMMDWQNFENSANYDLVKPEKRQKVCPFERQNVLIGGGECLKEKCAWWSEELKNCIVFAPILESEASLQKEINTVLYGGVVQGGED